MTPEIPAPEYVIRGNKVRCVHCGRTFKTRRKYVHHWPCRASRASGVGVKVIRYKYASGYELVEQNS